MASKKLSTAQSKALRVLWDTKEHKTSKAKIMITFDKLVEYGYAASESYKFVLGNMGKVYTLTDSGLQLARTLFTTPTPDPEPTSEPVADAPVSEPCNHVWDIVWIDRHDDETGNDTKDYTYQCHFCDVFIADTLLERNQDKHDPEPPIIPSPVSEPIVHEDGMLEFENHAHFQDYMGIEPKQGIALPKTWAKLQEIAAEDGNPTEPASTPAPVVAENETPEPVAPRYSVAPSQDGKHWQIFDSVLGQPLMGRYFHSEVAQAEVDRMNTPVASKPVSKVTMLRREDLIKAPFANRQQSLCWYGEDTYLYRYRYSRFADINGYAIAQKPRKGAYTSISGDGIRVKLSSTMNMERRVKSKPVAPKKEPMRETVMQIVSRIPTPLTGQVRRVA